MVLNSKFFQVGDKVPSVELYENNPTTKVNLVDLTKGKKVVVFAVPGAFTPGCSKVGDTHFLNPVLIRKFN